LIYKSNMTAREKLEAIREVLELGAQAAVESRAQEGRTGLNITTRLNAGGVEARRNGED
jgi:hypothetical protein